MLGALRRYVENAFGAGVRDRHIVYAVLPSWARDQVRWPIG
jgi:hypothetical protein